MSLLPGHTYVVKLTRLFVVREEVNANIADYQELTVLTFISTNFPLGPSRAIASYSTKYLRGEPKEVS